jgi:hypothetical protein
MQPFPASGGHGQDEEPGAECLLVGPPCDEIVALEPGYYLCPQCPDGLCDDFAPSDTEVVNSSTD